MTWQGDNDYLRFEPRGSSTPGEPLRFLQGPHLITIS